MSKIFLFIKNLFFLYLIYVQYSCGGYISHRKEETKENDDLNSRLIIAEIAGAGSHTCVRFTNGEIKCWGNNDYGKLGLGHIETLGDEPDEMGDNLPFVNLGTGLTAKKIYAGSWGTTCAIISENSKLKCWGRNHYGRLGLEDINHRGDELGEMGDNLPYVDLGTNRYVKDMVVSKGRHLCAILDNDKLKCWGQNNYGQLGLGHTNNIGDDPGEMGDNLTYVDVGTDKTVKKVTAGEYHTCALLNDNNVKCWGRGDYGRLGQEGVAHIGNEANEMGDNLNPIEFGTGLSALDLFSGNYHNCIILNTGNIKCWGRNNNGQLGLEDTVDRGDNAGEMGDDLQEVDLNGYQPITLELGFDHTCALFQDGSAKCWGNNVYGELGLGHTNIIGGTPGDMGSSLFAVDLGENEKILFLQSPNSYNCAILENLKIKCWGQNNLGQLGLEDTFHRGDNEDEMGSNLPYLKLF